MTMGGAFSELNNLLKADDIPFYYKPSIKAVMDTITLSSSENPNKWIPVSERLPEKNMVCLVAVGKINLTKIAVYSDLMGTINHKIFWRGDYGHENFRNITEYVKAWMPLPQPYKESEDKE